MWNQDFCDILVGNEDLTNRKWWFQHMFHLQPWKPGEDFQDKPICQVGSLSLPVDWKSLKFRIGIFHYNSGSIAFYLGNGHLSKTQDKPHNISRCFVKHQNKIKDPNADPPHSSTIARTNIYIYVGSKVNVWVPLKRVERDPLGMTLGVASFTGNLDRV